MGYYIFIFGVGLYLCLAGFYFYIGRRLERLRSNVVIRVMPGGIYGMVPGGLAAIFFGLGLLVHSVLIFWFAILLGVVAFILFFWHPDWVRPYWMRGSFGD